nr:hypothetical protein [Tanacetum cinerariifolium]
ANPFIVDFFSLSAILQSTSSDKYDMLQRNPVLRVLHKMITYGLSQRIDGYDKIQKNNLWLLSMFDARHQKGYGNVAWLIAWWMKRKGAGTQRESFIYRGQFITKLARKAKVLSDEVLRSLKLCHEFYSTYEFDKVCAYDELKTKKIIKFRLGGRAYSLTLLEFACRLGLYHAKELDEEGFDVHFRGGLRSDEHFSTQEYWLSIRREENLSLSRSYASTIRNPVLRVLHKMITYGLSQRIDGSNTSSTISYCLEHLVLNDPTSSSCVPIVYTSKTINNKVYSDVRKQLQSMDGFLISL